MKKNCCEGCGFEGIVGVNMTVYQAPDWCPPGTPSLTFCHSCERERFEGPEATVEELVDDLILDFNARQIELQECN